MVYEPPAVEMSELWEVSSHHQEQIVESMTDGAHPAPPQPFREVRITNRFVENENS